jgi:hypothetical protein
VRAGRRAARDLQVDGGLAIRQPVLTDQAVMDVDDLLGGHARIDPDAAKPVHEPAHVSIRLEQPAVHDAGDLVDAVTEDEAAIVDGERRTLTRQELAVEVNHTRHGNYSHWFGVTGINVGNRESGSGWALRNRETGDGKRETGSG